MSTTSEVRNGSTSAPARRRDPRLDVLKGVLIGGVVLGHFLETSGGQAPDGLYSGWSSEPQRAVLTALYIVHMPLFVLLAGVTASTRRRAHRIAQMVGLYLVLQVALLTLRGADVTPETLVHPVYGMWFLLAMAWWLAVLPVVRRLGRAALPVATLVSLVAVTAPVADTDVVAWARAACYLPFFVAGHLHGPALLRRTVDVGSALVGPAVLVLGGVTSAVLVWGVDPRWYRGADTAGSMHDSPAVALAVRVVCFAAAVVCSLALLALVPRRQRMAEVLGRRSLAIYALHVPFVFAAQWWFEGRGIDAWPASAIAVLMTVTSLALLAHPAFDTVLRRVGERMADVIVSTVRSSAGASRTTALQGPADDADLRHHPHRQPSGPQQLIL